MKNVATLIFLLLTLSVFPAVSENTSIQSDTTYILRGRVLGGDTNEPLANASITVQRSNLSGVTNQDGYFSLRITESSRNALLTIRHLGYENRQISAATLIDGSDNPIVLTPSSIQLAELQVISGDGADLVREALQRIPRNYAAEPNMMVAFYRESIRKNSNYISLVETVLDVHKASYRPFGNDQARIYIGRKATDISPRDTILLKFQGGISDALMLDIAKNPEIVFGSDGNEYAYTIDGMININNKPHYIISFLPREGISHILFRGTIYLDSESLAFARMEFNMNVEKRKDAANIFIRRKPPRMKVEVERARYSVDYIESGGRWYFNYSSTDVAFRVRWTNRFFGLFATTYAIGSEIAVTDRYKDNVMKFPRSERIHSTDVIAERVEYFQDPDFWGEYNVIEPDRQIADALRRLSGKLRRRAQ